MLFNVKSNSSYVACRIVFRRSSMAKPLEDVWISLLAHGDQGTSQPATTQQKLSVNRVFLFCFVAEPLGSIVELVTNAVVNFLINQVCTVSMVSVNHDTLRDCCSCSTL